MRVISPEILVARYIKSATNGRTVSKKINRVILIGLTLILLAGLINVSILTFEGIKAIPKYRKAKELLELSKRLDHRSEEYHAIFGCYKNEEWDYSEDARQIDPKTLDYLRQYGLRPNPYPNKPKNTLREGSFNPQIWEELRIVNPSSLDCGVELLAFAIQRNEIRKLLALPMFALILTLSITAIWILLRLIFWVANADKVKG